MKRIMPFLVFCLTDMLFLGMVKSVPLSMGLDSWTKGTIPASQYVNITQISTPYGNGISVKTIQSEHVWYNFFGYYNQETFPAGLVVNITGYFRCNWTRAQGWPERGPLAYFDVVELYVLSAADVSKILKTIRILDYAYADMPGEWYYNSTTISVEEEFRIAFGRYSSMSNVPDELEASWAAVDITIPPAPPAPVGGFVISVDKLALLAPWIVLAVSVAVAAISVVALRKRYAVRKALCQKP